MRAYATSYDDDAVAAYDALREYDRHSEVVLEKCDLVTFRCGDETKEGVVCIVDVHGTFEQLGTPSFDILVEEENMLYRHVSNEMIVTKELKTRTQTCSTR